MEALNDSIAQADLWEVHRLDLTYPVGFGGRVLVEAGVTRWVPSEILHAQAYDFIVPAHHSERVSTLRNWQASAQLPVDLTAFQQGDYAGAVRHDVAADALNWALFPDDSTAPGRELRLKREAFLVSASLQDVIARHMRETGNLHGLAKCNAIHLGDTRSALGTVELMRLLFDEHGLTWNEAWSLTQACVSYTNQTPIPEALEYWDLALVQALLPRHLEIIFEINQRFLNEVRSRFNCDDALIARLSIIDEVGPRRVRMASLAIVTAHKVNGVSKLQSEMMVKPIFADYAAMFPQRFHSITNGITPRRWLMQANPALARLIDRSIGVSWRQNLKGLSELAEQAGNRLLGREFLAVKRQNKRDLSELIRRDLGLVVDPLSLFDVQIKHVHEHKRQLLNMLHVVTRYQSIIAHPEVHWTPRTVIISDKAEVSDRAAKLILQLVQDVALVVNSDPRIAGRLKLVFMPNYRVSLAEVILPAADLSEQISMAGTEAACTSNMKFALNGALTISTWDGTNIEMAQAIGQENMFMFGLHAREVRKFKELGYDPRLYVDENRQLKGVIDAIAAGEFSRGDQQLYRPLVESLLHRDSYLVMADYSVYVWTQLQVDALYRTPECWAERALRNVAAMGEFCADRAVAQYVESVWSVAANP